METPIVMGQGELDPQHPPSKGELLDRLMAGSRVPLDEIRAKPGGHVFDEIQEVATAPFDTIDARLNVAPEGIAEELAALRAEPMPIPGRYGDDGRYTHLLISRRMRHVMNSVGQGWPGSEQRGTTNPAFVCRSDCERLGFGAGDLVVIESERSSIEAVIEPVDDLQPGVVSMSHAWGRNADHGPDVRKVGANTGRLIATDAHYDPITGMVRMSAIPVRLSRPNAR
jgi:anaerobic selenocysteine-containing dehydrogenase